MLISGFLFVGFICWSLVSVSSLDFQKVGCLCVDCFASLHSCGVHREYLLVLEDESGVGERKMETVSGNGVREERESTEVSCSRAGDETGRGVEDPRSSSFLVFCCAQYQNCFVLKLIFDLRTGQLMFPLFKIEKAILNNLKESLSISLLFFLSPSPLSFLIR